MLYNIICKARSVRTRAPLTRYRRATGDSDWQMSEVPFWLTCATVFALFGRSIN
jgi:hypothetical protein